MRKEVETYVGKKATVKLGGLVVEVKVTDVKHVYGRNRFLVTPVSGSGEVWVEVVTLTK
jgi:hypothetical protein